MTAGTKVKLIDCQLSRDSKLVYTPSQLENLYTYGAIFLLQPSSHLSVEKFKYSGYSTIPFFGFTESNFIDVKDFEWEINY